jgi:hypothetical protein
MRRIRELIETVSSKYPGDQFFDDFAETCRTNPSKRAAYRRYEDALRVLDKRSWEVLKDKAVMHFQDHRSGQLKQGFFNQLNEALAYRHLVRSGCTEVRMVPEQSSSTADICYIEAGELKHCEVKTLGISDDEIGRRCSANVFMNVYVKLAPGFFKKLLGDIDDAKVQIAAQGTGGLVYLVVLFDDIALGYYAEYRQEITTVCRKRAIKDVYIKMSLYGNRRISLIG